VSAARSQSETPGQDSFLDIVANLVGILIILVIVIGAQATDAMVEAAPAIAPVVEPELDVDPADAKRAVDAVVDDIHRIDNKIKRQQVEVMYRLKERDKMLEVVTMIEQRLEQRRAELDDTHRERLDASRRLMAARMEMEDLKASRQALESETSPENVIEHLPTPMAKTVFGKEVHFRLSAGRLTYVPWDELVEMLKQEAPRKVWKLKDVPRITETLGPERGFRMHYSLRRSSPVDPMSGGRVARQGVELDRFVLVPVREGMGEPLSLALQDGSEFRNILGQYNPDRTTVTVWVYPDSFNEFRQLKASLFQDGYLAAGRPMPADQPIGGSPQGTRSAAQ
jgi:hypothetical protein